MRMYDEWARHTDAWYRKGQGQYSIKGLLDVHVMGGWRGAGLG
jgi:hypothetical protein